MNCKQFETEWVTHGEEVLRTASMEEHHSGCPNCAAMVEDLHLIQDQVRQLRFEQDPPQRVWAAIHNQLEQEGLIREPTPAASRLRWKTAPATAWLFRLPMGLAYSSVFFLAIGAMYMQNRLSNPSAPPIVAVTAEVPDIAWVRPDTAESEKSVEELLAKLPEEHRATFRANWNQVNSSIQNLQSFVEAHPEDPFARPQLMNAFQQREHLRETLVRWEEF